MYIETTEAIVEDRKVPFFEIILCEVILCFGDGGDKDQGLLGVDWDPCWIYLFFCLSYVKRSSTTIFIVSTRLIQLFFL